MKATGYTTMAERAPDPADYPDADPALLVPGSLVFRPAAGPSTSTTTATGGPTSPERAGTARRPRLGRLLARSPPGCPYRLRGRARVRQMGGQGLPTEAEWERAARGGLENARSHGVTSISPHGRAMANTWQGEFPWQNLLIDGFAGTSPVGSFPPTGYGLSDMTGNVWEWTRDRFDADPSEAPCCGPPAGRRDRAPRHQGRLASVRARTTVCATGQRRVRAKRLTPRPATSASAA